MADDDHYIWLPAHQGSDFLDVAVCQSRFVSFQSDLAYKSEPSGGA
eukprot:CAMPEP_0180546486 /NCGR_PEP_ID=MMETSP1036_2-20121128/70585_1 /TAXON_ID=632150 /ORGANISM="Azadinium spinosum, Strain 3D9" /LENGTH=45 /DNA_ID= /DNA_START= /DNA_END= /DNA_ORIENTATION=